MEKPIIKIYGAALNKIEAFLVEEDYNLCMLAGDSGQGKSTLLENLLSRKTDNPIIFSSFDDEFSNFFTSTVKGLTSLIIKNEETFGCRWRHILGVSSVAMKGLGQLDVRLQPLLNGSTEQIDELSDRQTILRRAVKELFLLCCQNLPFALHWVIDSTENSTDSDLSFITDILEDPRSAGIKVILSVSTSDMRSQYLASTLENIHHLFIYLEPLDDEQSASFIESYLPHGSACDVNGVVSDSKGNIASLISNSLDFETTPFGSVRSDSNVSLDNALLTLPGGRLIASTAALMGSRFYSDDLHSLFPGKPREVGAVTDALVGYDILNTIGDHYSFTSTDSRSAVLQHLPSTQQRYTKDKIAAFYFKQKTENDSPIEWRSIANHLYYGLGGSSTALTRKEQILTYLEAAREAANIGEYDRAYIHSKKAISFVTASDWNDKADILFPLYKLAAKSSYINDDIDSMRGFTDVILCQSETMSEDFFDAYQILIEGYATKNLLDEALSTAIFALKMLGVRFPKKVGRLRAGLAILRLMFSIKGYDISSLPRSSDPKVQRVGRFLSFLTYAAYAKDENLSGYAIARGLTLCLQKGMIPETSYALAFWSSGVIAGFFKNIRFANKYSNEARNVSHLTSPTYRSRINFLHNTFVGYHIDPIKENVRALSRDVDNCLNDGVISFASYAAHVECFHDFDTDSPVDQIRRKIDKHLGNLKGYSRQNPDLWIRILRQLTHDICELDFSPSIDNGEYFSYENDINEEVFEQNKAAIFIANHYSVVRYLLAGRALEAQKSVDLSYKYMRYVRGTYGELLGIFSNCIFLAYKSNSSRVRTRDRVRIRFALSLFRHLAKQNSRVALAKLQAIEAIHLYCKGRLEDSLVVLDSAIDVSVNSGHLLDAIMLCRAAYDLFPCKNTDYLERAIELASRWAAPAVESSLRLALGRDAEQSCYVNPKLSEDNVLKYLIRCTDILNKRRGDDNKCICVARELRYMIGAAQCKWMPVLNNGSLCVIGSELDPVIERSFNERQVLIHNDLGQEICGHVIAPVQTPSINYGVFLFQTSPNAILSPSGIDAIKTVCVSLANTMTKNSQLLNMKYEATINTNLFENAAEGLLVASRDGQVRQFNKRLVDILGLSNTADPMTIGAIRKTINIGIDDRETLADFSSGVTDDCQIRATTLTGRYLLLSLKADEKLVHCCVSDITDTIRKSEQDETILQQARYFASAVHEIKNPLNTLMGYSNLSVRDTATVDEKTHFNRVINSSLLVLSDMFTDVISMSAITEGRFPIRKSKFRASDVIDIVSKTYLENALLRGINLEFDSTSIDGFLLETDKDRVGQVIRNLVSNSIKYSECNKIFVGLLEREGALIISVEDDGVGIPSVLRDKLFSPFTRASRKDADGSGLGLFICKKIVDQLGGVIEYDYSSNGGSVFTVALPCAFIRVKDIDDKPPSLLYEEPIIAGARVFIVDDEPLNCAYIEKILAPHYVDVISFTNFSDALLHLDSDLDFDLIISDLHIGRSSGFDLITLAREKMSSRKCNYLLLTGDIDQSVSNRCSQEQVFYLNKPVNENVLLDMVRSSVISPLKGAGDTPSRTYKSLAGH